MTKIDNIYNVQSEFKFISNFRGSKELRACAYN